MFVFFTIFAATNNNVKKDNKKATYYCCSFNGKKTASGEIFNEDSLTAAHKYLPFGTYVEVTNLNNNECILVKINDRLPSGSKSDIDLSKAAFEHISDKKQGRLNIEIKKL